MDNPMTPTFDLNLLGIVLITINVIPFLFMGYAMGKVAHYGPQIGLWEVPGPAAAGIGRTSGKRPRRKTLTIDQVRHVVVHEKVRVFELQHAEHHAKALKRIQERKSLATARVALRVKRRNLLRSGGVQQNKTAVLPAAFNAAAATTSSVPAGNGTGALAATQMEEDTLHNRNVGNVGNVDNVENIKKCLQEMAKNPRRLTQLVSKLLAKMGAGDLSHGLSYEGFETFVNACCTRKFQATPSAETIRIVWTTVQHHNVEEGIGASKVNIEAMVNWLF
jgi:hypothetical protein